MMTTTTASSGAAAAPAGGATNPAAGRQLFVGNLPYSVRDEDLRELFQSVGTVEHAEVVCNAQGRSRGFGTVLFGTVEEAQEAIAEFHNYQWSSRRIEVREDRAVSGLRPVGAGLGSGAKPTRNAGGSVPARQGQAQQRPSQPQQHQQPQQPQQQQQAVGSGSSSQASKHVSVVAAAAAMLSSTDSMPFGGLGAGGSYHTTVAPVAVPAVAGVPVVSAGGSPYAHGWASDIESDFNPTLGYNPLETFDVSPEGAMPGKQGGMMYGHDAKPHGHGADGQHDDGARGAGSRFDANNMCHLFVGNLPYSATWQAVKDLFRTAGNVHRVQVPVDTQGRSRGFAIVTMMTFDDATSAIDAFNGYMFSGRRLEVREDRHIRSRSGGVGAGASDSRPPPRQRQQGSGRDQLAGESDVHHDGDAEASHGAEPAAEQGGAAAATPSASSPRAAGHAAASNGSPSAAHDGQAGDAGGSQTGRTLFVGNLPFSTHWQQLKDLFRTTGGFVMRAEIATDNTGRSRGFGFVIMSSSEDAALAISKLNQTEFNGRVIEVRHDKYSPGESKAATQIFVGNLPFQMRWQELKDIFRNGLTPVHADIQVEPVSGRSKGYGTVRFETPEEALKATELDGTEVAGRTITVRLDKFAV